MNSQPRPPAVLRQKLAAARLAGRQRVEEVNYALRPGGCHPNQRRSRADGCSPNLAGIPEAPAQRPEAPEQGPWAQCGP